MATDLSLANRYAHSLALSLMVPVNRRFLQLCSHHLVEPVACTPAAGWEKGQVENQVGTVRDLLFRPQPKTKSLDELNAWLADQCIAYARRTRHPEQRERTIYEVFEEEQASLTPFLGPFAGFVEKPMRATSTCLVAHDRNRYSVDARAADVVATGRGSAGWMFPSDAAARLLARLRSRAGRPGPTPRGFESLPLAARRHGASVGEVVALVLRGGVEVRARWTGRRGIVGLHVDPGSLPPHLPPAGKAGVSVPVAARELGLSRAAMDRVLAASLLWSWTIDGVDRIPAVEIGRF